MPIFGGQGSVSTTGTAPLVVRMDTKSTTSVTYIGYAQIGIATSVAAWRILRLNESGSPETLVTEYADGNANFDKIWDNRASLSYS